METSTPPSSVVFVAQKKVLMTELTISVLGTAHYTRGGRPVGDGLYSKAAGLLVYLAMESDRPHGRAMLAELLWPGQDGERSRHSLRQALSTIRRVLDDDLGQPLLLATRESIQFNRESGARIDAARMVELDAVCERHDHEALERCPGCVARLEELVGLYRGDFLTGFPIGDSEGFENWLVVWQQRLRQLAIDAWGTIASWYEVRGDLDRASDAIAHQIAIAPWLEASYRRQMDLLWRQGKRLEALALFERCQTVLDEELGDEPEAETVALFDLIASSKAPPHGEVRRPGWTHTLPIAQDRLIGRQRDLQQIGDLLARRDCRLLTLTGPGGCGKTRLAMALTEKQAELGVRDVHVVALAPIAEPGQVAQAIAAELGVSVHGTSNARQQLLAWARDRSLFLMLDNAEHLVEDLDIVPALLQASPGIQILVTSRERLQVRGEWLHEVNGLDVPGDGDARPEEFGAVELLVERLHQAGMTTAADPSNSATLRDICQLVDGMPLAIELAAAWARTLPLEEIANQIRANLDFLATSMRDVEPRHRSMRAVFEQTWQMLTPLEQGGYCRLTVFEEGFRLDAAWAVAQANTAKLDLLVGKSLVVQLGDGTYRLHPVLRQYGRERLEEDSDTAAALHERHARWYLGRLARWEDELTGKNQRVALAEIVRDMGNIQAAWGWAVRRRDFTMVLESAHALWLVYAIRGSMREGEAAFGAAVAAFSESTAADGDDHRERIQALATSLMRQGGFLSGVGRYDEGIALIERSLELLDAETQGSERGLALNMLAAAYKMKGNLGHSRELLEESLQVFQSVHDRWGTAFSLNDLGLISHLMKDEVEAETFCEQGRAMFRSIGDRRGNAFATFNLGLIASSQGEHTRSQRLFRESLALRQDSHDQWGIAASLVQLAAEARNVGSPLEAQRLYLRALQVAWESTVTPMVLDAMVGLATLKLDADEIDEAEDLLGAVVAHPAIPAELRSRITTLRPDLAPPNSGDHGLWAIESVNDLAKQLLALD
jgi:predicted ATPase/DNA-binding SARP family transcriptional activator